MKTKQEKEKWARSLETHRLVFHLFYNKGSHDSTKKITASERKILLQEHKNRYGISWTEYLKRLASEKKKAKWDD
jgi:hypothetical protein